MRYAKVNKNLFVVEQEIDKKKQVLVKEPTNVNHIFIYDRSGSMYGVLDQLCSDLKQRMRKTQAGDTITIGWFSGEGQFNFPLKGFKVTDKGDFNTLDKVIDANNTTVGLTCFSQILHDTKTVVNDLQAFGKKFSLCFFTDGYPVVSNYSAEIKAINTAIDAVAGTITSSIMVGYGNYYNKDLMATMAGKFGGALVHSSDIGKFPLLYGEFIDKSRDLQEKIHVELHALPHADGAAFNLSGGQVNVLEVDAGKVSIAPTKGATDRVYTITNKKPSGGEECDLSTANASNETMFKAMYAAAMVLVQRAKTDLAIEVLAAIGDKALVDRASNSFTNEEYGTLETMIQEAIGSSSKRFTAGRSIGCIPRVDAFCVMDVIKMLMADPEAEFYPQYPDFRYNRIGVPSKTKDGYPTFEPDQGSRVPLLDLVWNESKLNLSIRTKIDGKIKLLGDYKSVGLGRTFDTFVWRNYTIIKDGFLNVTKLPVSLGLESYNRLLSEGVIDKEHNRHYAGRVYVLNLDRLPVINGLIATGKTSAKDLCDKVLREKELMAELKALNFVRNEIKPKDQSIDKFQFTPEQEEYLKTQGVTKSGFNPPSVKGEVTDFYMAKEFEIKMKGVSSLPKVDEVRAKVASKKPLNRAAALLQEGLRHASLATNGVKTDADKLAVLDTEISKAKAELNTVRSSIQETKFSVILAHKWFDEFKSREDNKVTNPDGDEFTISVREVKVEI